MQLLSLSNVDSCSWFAHLETLLCLWTCNKSQKIFGQVWCKRICLLSPSQTGKNGCISQPDCATVMQAMKDAAPKTQVLRVTKGPSRLWKQILQPKDSLLTNFGALNDVFFSKWKRSVRANRMGGALASGHWCLGSCEVSPGGPAGSSLGGWAAGVELLTVLAGWCGLETANFLW